MPRVLVIDDEGGLTWSERIRASDFETEHFRHCLTDRLRWAVSDAEACTHASLIPPLRPTQLMPRPPDRRPADRPSSRSNRSRNGAGPRHQPCRPRTRTRG